VAGITQENRGSEDHGKVQEKDEPKSGHGMPWPYEERWRGVGMWS